MANVILTGSVGIGGINKFTDIKNVQKALNQLLKLISPIAKLVEDGKLGRKLQNCRSD